jgi:hypothetical protein
MAAALADVGAMEILSGLLKTQGRDRERVYWSMLRELNTAQGSDRLPEFYESFYRDVLQTANDRSFFEHVLAEFALSKPLPARGALPGRSIFTAFFSDLMMRRQLEFVWRAFLMTTTSRRMS